MGAARTRAGRVAARRALVLDAGALIAIERNDVRVRVLVDEATRAGGVLYIPAGALAQVWRDGGQQARLARFLKSSAVVVQPLDRSEAEAAGVRCGRSATNDIVDASVVVLARRLKALVVTSDAGDLRRIDAALDFIEC